MNDRLPNARILIVDDDRELGEMLKEFLEPDHFELTARLSGEDGLQALQDEEFDLLILDIMLPGISGIDVLRQVRQSNDIPIVMLTARGDDVDRILSYDRVTEAIDAELGAERLNLLETLAARVAERIQANGRRHCLCRCR